MYHFSCWYIDNRWKFKRAVVKAFFSQPQGPLAARAKTWCTRRTLAYDTAMLQRHSGLKLCRWLQKRRGTTLALFRVLFFGK